MTLLSFKTGDQRRTSYTCSAEPSAIVRVDVRRSRPGGRQRSTVAEQLQNQNLLTEPCSSPCRSIRAFEWLSHEAPFNGKRGQVGIKNQSHL